MLPKLTITVIPNHIFDDIEETGKDQSQVRMEEKKRVIGLICDKNPCIRDLVNIGHTLDVIYLRRYQNDHFVTIGIKVSAAIRKAIIDQQRRSIYIVISCCPTTDRYHSLQCYHC